MGLNKKIRGQSIVEVIIAVSIFLIIAGSSVITVIGSLSASRLAEEETIATTYAVEGLEAVESIRNRDWDNLTDGTYGLNKSLGLWELDGSSETLGRYTRVIQVDTVQRDGTPDPNAKLVTSTVGWDFSPTRANSVELVTYKTNWQEASSTVGGETPTATATPTPSPTNTPSASSCSEYCVGLGYSGGACRRNPGQCNQNGETNEAGGDQFCTQSQNNICCCQP